MTGKRQRQGAVKLPEFKPPRKKKCEISDCDKWSAPKCGLCSACLNPHWKKGCSEKSQCPRLFPVQKNEKTTAVKLNTHPFVVHLAENSNIDAESDNVDIINPTESGDVLSDQSVITNLYGDIVNDLSEETVPVVPLLEPGDRICDPLPVLLVAAGPSQDVPSVEVVGTVSDMSSNVCENKNDHIPSVDFAKEVSTNSVMGDNDGDITTNDALKKTLWQCNRCEKIYSQFKSFNKHVCHKTSLKIPCPSCNKQISKKFMKIHLKMHSALKFNCSICSRSFLSKEKLDKHIMVHTVKGKTCDICGEEFSSLSLLRKHIVKVHPEDNDKNQEKETNVEQEVTSDTQCRFCGNNFPNLAVMKKHMKESHPIEATIACHICPKVYFSKRGLRKHLKEHGGISSIEVSSEAQRDTVETNEAKEDTAKKSNEAEENVVIFQDGNESYLIEIEDGISADDIRALPFKEY